MDIWVDADACPAVIKDILFRAATRTGTRLTLVANQPLRVPRSPLIQTLQVGAGFDMADDAIVERVQSGDLVITADIPLADAVISKGARALNPRGELYTEENIKATLNLRDFMDTLRSSGIQTGGAAALNQRDRQQFANQLDRLLAHT
ncbi:MAG TPA: YaiI/YqxD family protein [Thiohalobacter sp.]|nr:YaiI/YqxD family protein [Thiohalobacter sp.]